MTHWGTLMAAAAVGLFAGAVVATTEAALRLPVGLVAAAAVVLLASIEQVGSDTGREAPGRSTDDDTSTG